MSLSEFPQSGAVFCSNSLSPNRAANKPSPGLAWPGLPSREETDWVWWCRSAVPTFKRLRQEDHDFMANAGYVVSLMCG